MPYSEIELERRKERVRVLLESHDDVYDSLSRNETTHSGFGEPVMRTFQCSCAGAGCGQCERSAARAAELGVDLPRGRVLAILRDPYDTGIKGAFDPEARTRRERAKLMDDTIERLKEIELVREGVYSEKVDHEHILELAAARDARGSYRELRVALDSLPLSLRGEAAVGWLAEHMPSTIRIPRWAYEREVELIAESVLLLKAVGKSVSEIAELLSVSRRQVRTVLRSARQ